MYCNECNPKYQGKQGSEFPASPSGESRVVTCSGCGPIRVDARGQKLGRALALESGDKRLEGLGPINS